MRAGPRYEHLQSLAPGGRKDLLIVAFGETLTQKFLQRPRFRGRWRFLSPSSKDWIKIKNHKHPAYRRVQYQF
jgi:hypothetical protein